MPAGNFSNPTSSVLIVPLNMYLDIGIYPLRISVEKALAKAGINYLSLYFLKATALRELIENYAKGEDKGLLKSWVRAKKKIDQFVDDVHALFPEMDRDVFKATLTQDFLINPVINQLLNELENLQTQYQIYIVGVTTPFYVDFIEQVINKKLSGKLFFSFNQYTLSEKELVQQALHDIYKNSKEQSINIIYNSVECPYSILGWVFAPRAMRNYQQKKDFAKWLFEGLYHNQFQLLNHAPASERIASKLDRIERSKKENQFYQHSPSFHPGLDQYKERLLALTYPRTAAVAVEQKLKNTY